QGVAALFKRSERVDRERAEALIDGCWLLCRDLVFARAGAPPALLTDPARADALADEAARWSDDAALYRAIEACREARLALINNVTPRLTVDTLLARVARWSASPPRTRHASIATSDGVRRRPSSPAGGSRARVVWP